MTETKQRNIGVALECFVQKDGEYLMLHRHPTKKIMPNVWMAPGGKRNFNEGLFACAKREIREETGLEIKNLKVKVIGNAYIEDLDLELYFHFLTAEWAGGELTPETEIGELVWLAPRKIFELDNLLAELKEVLPHVLGDNDMVISYTAVYRSGNEMIEFLLENPE